MKVEIGRVFATYGWKYLIFNEDDQICSNKDIFRLEAINCSVRDLFRLEEEYLEIKSVKPLDWTGNVLAVPFFISEDIKKIESALNLFSFSINGKVYSYNIEIPFPISKLFFWNKTKLDEPSISLKIIDDGSGQRIFLRIYSDSEYVEFKLPNKFIKKSMSNRDYY